MVNRVVVSPQADLDVDEIWSHIAAENLTAANALTDRFTATSRMLADAPRTGRARPEFRDHVRSFPVGSYIIFYIPLTDGVRIVRIMHGKRKITTTDVTP